MINSQGILDSSGSELKPCPFCGGEAEMMGDQYPYVECQECAVGFTANHSYEFDEGDAAGMWNQRAGDGIQGAEPAPDKWLIQLRGDYLVTRGVWERPDHRGYTNDISEAGRYSEGEAKKTESMAPEKYKAVRLPYYTQPQSAEPERYPDCDTCGSPMDYMPWHYATETERHLHACDECWPKVNPALPQSATETSPDMSEKPACNCPMRSGAHDYDCPVSWFEWGHLEKQANVRIMDVFRQLKAELSQAQARVAKLEAALREARANLHEWSDYVPEYFQEKHGLEQDLAAIDRVLGAE